MTLKYGLIEPIDLPISALPACLDGLRIAHITDLHVTRFTGRHRRLIDQITRHRLDLACFTGDYMNLPGDEAATLDVMRQLTERLRPRLGSYGVFGNHDTAEMIERLGDLPVRWLANDAIQIENEPLELWGLTGQRCEQADAAKLAITADASLSQTHSQGEQTPSRFKLMLAHHPDALPTASDLSMHLLLAGHTHGGQLRLPTGHALVNASAFPLSLTSGLFRHRDTLAMVSRGLGETHVGLRLFCPPHVPVYTLRRRTTPGRATDGIDSVWRW